jgi:mRNA interferase RelE/StbE
MAEATVEYSTRAADQLEDLETETAERIVSKLDDVTWNVEHYLKGRQMTGQPYYSLRVGDYRAIIDWQRAEGNGDVLFVRRVAHRENVYD